MAVREQTRICRKRFASMFFEVLYSMNCDSTLLPDFFEEALATVLGFFIYPGRDCGLSLHNNLDRSGEKRHGRICSVVVLETASLFVHD